MSDTLTVEIPADVKDNNHHTVRFQWRGVADDTLTERDLDLARQVFHYDVYVWEDVAPDGQRVTLTRMDKDGKNVWFYGTYHFTRVGCKPCESYRAQSYASHYVVQDHGDGPSDPMPFCDEHLHQLRRSAPEARINLSEPLRIGQHD